MISHLGRVVSTRFCDRQIDGQTESTKTMSLPELGVPNKPYKQIQRHYKLCQLETEHIPHTCTNYLFFFQSYLVYLSKKSKK
jgi:hypothetical protein